MTRTPKKNGATHTEGRGEQVYGHCSAGRAQPLWRPLWLREGREVGPSG